MYMFAGTEAGVGDKSHAKPLDLPPLYVVLMYTFLFSLFVYTRSIGKERELVRLDYDMRTEYLE